MTYDVSIQVLVELLREYGINTIVHSNSVCKTALFKRFEKCDFFKFIYVEDDRSAGYVASGLSAETNRPVVLMTREGASYRSTLPAMTEAFYRALPIVAITIVNNENYNPKGFVGYTDSTIQFKDIINKSIHLVKLVSQNDVEKININLNEILQELIICGGPIQIRVDYYDDRLQEQIVDLDTFIIPKITKKSNCPPLPKGKIGFLVGYNHFGINELETEKIEEFTRLHKGLVYCNNESNYFGENLKLLSDCEKENCDLLIIYGDIIPEYNNSICSSTVWYVNNCCSVFPQIHNLKCCFEMSIGDFVSIYGNADYNDSNYLPGETKNRFEKQIIDYSRDGISYVLSDKLTDKDVLYVGYSTNLKNINKYKFNAMVRTNCGIIGNDGLLSMALGASLVRQEKGRIFVFLDDYEFIRDMNTLGNYHFGNNITVIMIKSKYHNYNWKGYSTDCGLMYFFCDSIECFRSIIQEEINKSCFIECVM